MIALRQLSSRHPGIHMHPESISKLIMPGNQVERTNNKGLTTKRYTELVYGYFWMISDLKKSDNRPILPMEIPSETAQVFPDLTGLQSLSGRTVNLPDYFLRKNRSQDPTAQCTLVAISYREFGFQQLPSWINAFQAAFAGKDRFETIKINVADGWFNRWMLRWLIISLNKRNTPIEEHAATFICFGDNEKFRDDLRMHNLMPGYVFLLDGQGRVRFAASGEATEEYTNRLVQLAQKLTPTVGGEKQRGKSRSLYGKRTRR